MAVRRKKSNIDIMKVVKATAGGGIAEVVMNLASQNVSTLKDNQMLTSLIPAVIGSAGLYLSKDDSLHPAFYGMLGASGAELTDEFMGDALEGLSMNGFSRMNYILPENVPSQPVVSPVAEMDGVSDEEMSMMIEEMDGI